MTSKTNDVQPFPNASTPTATLTAGLVITTPTLTDLKLISAMCLQGMLGNGEFAESHPTSLVSYSIIYAKELLKQLEVDND